MGKDMYKVVLSKYRLVESIYQTKLTCTEIQ